MHVRQFLVDVHNRTQSYSLKRRTKDTLRGLDMGKFDPINTHRRLHQELMKISQMFEQNPQVPESESESGIELESESESDSTDDD